MPERFDFPREARLAHAREFEAIHAAKLRRSVGPLSVQSRPNGLPGYRLGLSIGRRAGGAVERNRAKRLVREAFRLDRGGYPRRADGGYDILVSLRAPMSLRLTGLRAVLARLVQEAHDGWEARRGADP